MTSRGAWVEVLGAAVVGAVELGGAIGMQVWFEGLPPDERPVPVLANAPWILVGLACFAFAYSCLRVCVRAREPGSRVPVALALAGHLVLTGAGAMGVLVADPDFLFGHTLDDTLELPDGRTAYLYRGGLFCSYEVFVATPDDWFSFRKHSIDSTACEKRGHLVLEGEQIKVVDEHGNPMPASKTNWAAAFDLYPH